MLIDNREDMGCILQTLLCVIASHVTDEITYRVWNRRRKIKRWICLIEGQFPQDGRFWQTGVGYGAGQHFVHHESQTVQVATDVEQLLLRDFWR